MLFPVGLVIFAQPVIFELRADQLSVGGLGASARSSIVLDAAFIELSFGMYIAEKRRQTAALMNTS